MLFASISLDCDMINFIFTYAFQRSANKSKGFNIEHVSLCNVVRKFCQNSTLYFVNSFVWRNIFISYSISDPVLDSFKLQFVSNNTKTQSIIYYLICM